MDLEPLLAFVHLHQVPVGDKFADKLTARTRSSQVGFVRIAETLQKVPDASPPNQQTVDHTTTGNNDTQRLREPFSCALEINSSVSANRLAMNKLHDSLDLISVDFHS